MNQANAILNSLENDTMNSFNDFSGSNSRVNDLNESEFRKMFNSWFSSESYKLFLQAAVVFNKVFPDKEPDKEYIKEIAGDILSYKFDCLEEFL